MIPVSPVTKVVKARIKIARCGPYGARRALPAKKIAARFPSRALVFCMLFLRKACDLNSILQLFVISVKQKTAARRNPSGVALPTSSAERGRGSVVEDVDHADVVVPDSRLPVDLEKRLPRVPDAEVLINRLALLRI